MISVTTLLSLALATLIIAAMPIVLYRKLRPRFAIVPRYAILGIAVFALFAMVIERALHGFMLSNPVRRRGSSIRPCSSFMARSRRAVRGSRTLSRDEMAHLARA